MGTTAASGPEYVDAVHSASPETASVPVHLTVTGLETHPFALAPGSGTAGTAAGGVLSILTFASAVIVAPGSQGPRQPALTPAVSPPRRTPAPHPHVLTSPWVPASP